jgi:type II secretory pathway pseudopilin PulG
MALLSRAGEKSGLTLVGLLALVLLLEIALSMAAPLYSMSVKRSNEAELRSRLLEIKRALDRFRRVYNRYPLKLEELVTKPPNPRFLRKLYADPITGHFDWKPIFDIDNVSIRNVHSSSTEKAADGLPYAAWFVNDEHKFGILEEYRERRSEHPESFGTKDSDGDGSPGGE